MATQKWAIILIIFMTLITSTAQIFYKLAAMRFSLSAGGILLNWPLWIGAILYIVSSIMMIIAFKGGDISVLYPLIALSYVWVSLVSPRFFPADSMNTLKWCGVIAIIGGVSLIGLGGRK
jgi:multidrug transporter EmrE-like cation transporter